MTRHINSISIIVNGTELNRAQKTTVYVAIKELYEHLNAEPNVLSVIGDKSLDAIAEGYRKNLRELITLIDEVD